MRTTGFLPIKRILSIILLPLLAIALFFPSSSPAGTLSCTMNGNTFRYPDYCAAYWLPDCSHPPEQSVIPMECLRLISEEEWLRSNTATQTATHTFTNTFTNTFTATNTTTKTTVQTVPRITPPPPPLLDIPPPEKVSAGTAPPPPPIEAPPQLDQKKTAAQQQEQALKRAEALKVSLLSIKEKNASAAQLYSSNQFNLQGGQNVGYQQSNSGVSSYRASSSSGRVGPYTLDSTKTQKVSGNPDSSSGSSGSISQASVGSNEGLSAGSYGYGSDQTGISERDDLASVNGRGVVRRLGFGSGSSASSKDGTDRTSSANSSSNGQSGGNGQTNGEIKGGEAFGALNDAYLSYVGGSDRASLVAQLKEDEELRRKIREKLARLKNKEEEIPEAQRLDLIQMFSLALKEAEVSSGRSLASLAPLSVQEAFSMDEEETRQQVSALLSELDDRVQSAPDHTLTAPEPLFRRITLAHQRIVKQGRLKLKP